MKALPIIALSIFAAGCATTNELKIPKGAPIRINSPAEIEDMLAETGVALVGPRSGEEIIKRHFMRHPMAMLSRKPDPSEYERIGAALVPTTVTVTFADGSTAFEPDGTELVHLMQLAASDRLDYITVSGRTGNKTPTPQSEWMATARAEAAKERLIGMGVAAEQIVVNAMGAGDPVGNYGTSDGRAQNRRVEVRFTLRGRS